MVFSSASDNETEYETYSVDFHFPTLREWWIVREYYHCFMPSSLGSSKIFDICTNHMSLSSGVAILAVAFSCCLRPCATWQASEHSQAPKRTTNQLLAGFTPVAYCFLAPTNTVRLQIEQLMPYN
jgi:hypothetical protein